MALSLLCPSPTGSAYLTVAFIIQEFDIGLILHTLSDPFQQPLQSWISRSTDLFVQHDYRGEPFPQSMGFIVPVPLFRSEGFPLVP